MERSTDSYGDEDYCDDDFTTDSGNERSEIEDESIGPAQSTQESQKVEPFETSDRFDPDSTISAPWDQRSSATQDEHNNELPDPASLQAEAAEFEDDAENDDTNSIMSRVRSLEADLEREKSVTEQLRTELAEARTGPLLVSEEGDSQDTESLHRKIWETSKRLVSEGEKNVKLALQVEKTKDDVSELRKEIKLCRQLLLQGINGGVSDVQNYAHVGLCELLRLRLQESDQKSEDEPETESGQPGSSRAGNNSTSSSTNEPSGAIDILQKLERDLAAEQRRNDALMSRCAKLKDEVGSTSTGLKEVKTLKRRIGQMVERSRNEKAMRAKLEKETSIANEKVEALADHIEKLMIHLKHEAITKAQALADLGRSQREVELLTARNQTMAKRNKRKDRAIIELKEGGKILEDQLRLMDEKYMELRMKLDWTRTQTERIIKKKEEETRQLRAKFALVAEVTPANGNKGPTPLLDEYEFGATKKPAPKKTKQKKKKASAGDTRQDQKNVAQTLSSRDNGIT